VQIKRRGSSTGSKKNSTMSVVDASTDADLEAAFVTLVQKRTGSRPTL
jgi:hypothetical protein